MKIIAKFAIVGIALISMFGCSSDDGPRTAEEIIAENEEAILNYLENNNIEATATGSGLYYVVHEEGNDVYPEQNSSVKVNYSGYNLSGNVFDANDDITFSLESVIPGWQEGMQYFSEGSSGQLFIPSYLAYYNSDPSYGMPIVFDVDLIEVVN